MTRQSGHGRAGFTLIELLVVIAIIAVIMGLLLAAVMQVLGTGPKADTIARLTNTGSAIGTFKAERQAKYIPAGSVDINPTLSSGAANPTYGQVVGKFRLRNSYTATTTPDLNSFEAQYIASVFGSRVNLANLGNTNTFGGDLDANQTLLFFLNGIQTPDGQGNTAFTGFSSNSQQPFITASVGAGESRKGPYLELNRKRYEVDTTNNFARLLDAYGSPFAYFVAYNGKPGVYDQNAAGLIANTYANGTALPYKNGGRYVNESGWQLISAGKDKTFKDPTLVTPPTFFLDWSNLDQNKVGDSRDNLANFSTTFLSAGPK
jgi:prepilin-type N-terminal cleavage/methylation domain-containing protein